MNVLVAKKGLCATDWPVPTMIVNREPFSKRVPFSTNKLLRSRLIASGQLRPRNDNELDQIQLPPGTVVYRIEPGAVERWAFGPAVAYSSGVMVLS